MNECNKNDDFLWHKVGNLSVSNFKCLFVYLVHQNSFSKWDYPIAFGYIAPLLLMNGASATIAIKDIKVYKLDIFSVKIKNDHPYLRICLFNSEQHQHEMLLCSPKAEDFARILME